MWENFKIRCSSISKVMSNSRSNPIITEKQKERMYELLDKNDLTDKQALELAELQAKDKNSSKLILSDTCIEYLMEAYAYEVYGKRSINKELDVEYTAKGKMVEEDSITLLSRLDKSLYKKNDQRVENDYLSGEPDVHDGVHDVMQATQIIDIKSVWDYPGFLKKIHAKLDSNYDYQLKGYMDITGATSAYIAYCLVNTPETIVNDFRRRLFYKMNVATEENPEYLIEAAKLEHSMYFEDIPVNQRVFKVNIEPFTDEQRKQVYERVKVCREWLEIFHENYQKLNLNA